MRSSEREIGAPLEWNPHPDQKEKVIRLVRKIDPTDRGRWPEAIDWLVQTLVRFRDTFRLRIQRGAPRTPGA